MIEPGKRRGKNRFHGIVVPVRSLHMCEWGAAVIARSGTTKQSRLFPRKHSGLLRFARNDGVCDSFRCLSSSPRHR
ncbi:MAG: hypothetical protein EKK33_32090 [Bradyrhizobiaceae bacterium]|nr:MAG: hypothetical protein EKK33_32090 [Bradyrhizobiaceae bacterium]